MTEKSPVRCVIFTPLAYERDVLSRVLKAPMFAYVVCGMGGAHRPSRDIQPDVRGDVMSLLDRGTPAVLAGVAGSIDVSIEAGRAWSVKTVVSDVEQWDPPLVAMKRSCRLASVDAIVNDAAERAELRRRTDCQLVDLESAWFARLATKRGWRWGVVRGVSDDPTRALPGELTSLIRSDGTPRMASVLRAVTRRPQLALELMGLQRRSRAALREAAELISILLVV